MDKKLNILLIGGGGREYALAWKISLSKYLNKLFSINGSDGIKKFAEIIDIDWRNFNLVENFCKEKIIDLVVIGPEDPIVEGLSDFLRLKGFLVFAPSRQGAQIESSKEFMKKICDEKNIPTAKYSTFNNLDKLIDHLSIREEFPVVLKYDGLAAGKGVKIAYDLGQALSYSRELVESYGSDARIIVEDFISGHEISFFAITDGKIAKKFTVAQDHKRAFDNDQGENTGGMGVISGDFLIDQNLEDKIMSTIIQPTVDCLNENNIEYKGVLFAGLMIDEKGDPYLLEFNARFGDPETEAMMLRLESDLVEILYKTAQGELNNLSFEFSKKSSICVVLATKGYPGSYEKNLLVANDLEDDSDNVKIFHHGTKINDKKIYSNGGRVLSVNVLGDSVKEIRNQAYQKLQNINWKDGFYRSDIGKKYEEN